MPTQRHAYLESRRVSHQSSMKAEKTTWTNLKYGQALTFWMVPLQAPAAPSVPAKEVTHRILAPQ